MADFSQIMMDSARDTSNKILLEEIERKKRLDPNYKPGVPKKLIFWFVGTVGTFAATVLILYLVHQY